MLDEVTVMHRGGLVLWNHSFGEVRGNPVNQLIKTRLLAEGTADTSFIHDTYKVQWQFDNNFDLIFIVVYQHLLTLSYIEELLKAFKELFANKFGEVLSTRAFLTDPCTVAPHKRFSESFLDDFRELLRKVEAKAEMGQSYRGLRSFRKAEAAAADPAEEEEDLSASTQLSESKRTLTGRALAMQRALEGGGSMRKGGKPGGKKTPAAPAKRPKDDRVWGGGSSAPAKVDTDAGKGVQKVEVTKHDLGWGSESDDEQPEQTRGRLSQWIRSRFGGIKIDEADLETILPKLRETLTEKNVAHSISEQLTKSVAAELMGKSVSGFSSLDATIKQAMEAALLRILSPKRNIDVLREIREVRGTGRPYVIAFCGVNGVGKSTNLSKVAYWLKGQGLDVMIAACDTFRSGAVEQLLVHSRRIDVPVFQKGYAKDAAEVAAHAIQQAKREGRDVVLVDTAGRMQDNAPLMAALAKLIHTNKPNLVLFVGEALVGNDGVDQLKKFNRALEDHTPVGMQTRGIDGILLTKFDTIDDKVGAAISMVHESGQPIVFVGVGQQYQDLRSLNPSVVVKSLLR
eukprot:TRINITY_DN213_c2_g1_i1.p1 TRINITY_DN213_c2_g1~~TRINITY_DN213_c2_g1_i1.p1  ORF type:complete len:570 (+),score=199.85 TRINITY_DN213_c2_g1_i1:76-1785(+)